jgi:toxin ParE1/3/4
VTAKQIVPRALANRDVDEAIAYYLSEAGNRVASGFVDALERAYRHISRHPASGSFRYAVELSLPGLRAWPLSQFPHIVFYLETADCIDVWRVLHGARDIPAWMRESDPE